VRLVNSRNYETATITVGTWQIVDHMTATAGIVFRKVAEANAPV
jgi:hypothetical protein